MVELETMYPGIAFSPQTKLTAAINETDTVISVESTAGLPDGPNYATIGTDENAETVYYAVKLPTQLSGCVRGVEGLAKAWTIGDVLGRNFTAKDYEAILSNILALNKKKQDAGDPLATFYPTVSETGDLSWSNDQGLENPKTVNIMGPQGLKGETGAQGATGYTPQKGVDYFDGSNGKDGTSCAHSWNGTTLTVTSASGTSSANLKGDKGDKGDTGATGATGADGKTPVKGTDYYTEADKTEMVNLVLAALPTWTGGSY